MAKNVVFIKTTNPSSVPIVDGQIVFDISGSGKIYIDDGSTRKETGGSKSLDTEFSLTSTAGVQNKTITAKLNSIDGDIEGVVASVGDLRTETFEIATFSVSTALWSSNTDSATKGAYPWKATISTSDYNNNSAPIWQMISNSNASGIPSSAEIDSINVIERAYFSNSSIILYATEKPTVALKLQVRGK